MVIGVGAVAMIIMGFIAIKNFDAVEEDWSEYVQVVKTKQDHLMDMRSEMGYGGAIHKFKNYVLRGKEKDHDKYMVKAKTINDSITKYRALGSLTPTETSALDKVTEMVEKYRKATITAKGLLEGGNTIKEIDGSIKINDSPYLKALASLSKELDQATSQRTEALTSRV